MTTKTFAAAVLVAGMAVTGASARPRVTKPITTSIACLNLLKANAVVTSDNKVVHYTVNPGGDPSEIRLEFKNAERVYVDLSGHLVMKMSDGNLRTYNATFYQMVEGKKKLISGNFRVLGATRAAFQVGKFNSTLPLEIDTNVGANGDNRG